MQWHIISLNATKVSSVESCSCCFCYILYVAENNETYSYIKAMWKTFLLQLFFFS